MRGVKQTEAEKAEDWFRVTAFHAAYTHTLRDVRDKTVRFARAIQISAQPIPAERMPLVLAGYRADGKGLAL